MKFIILLMISVSANAGYTFKIDLNSKKVSRCYNNKSENYLTELFKTVHLQYHYNTQCIGSKGRAKMYPYSIYCQSRSQQFVLIYSSTLNKCKKKYYKFKKG